VLLVFCESAIGHWRAGGGEVAYPGDMERHALSHAVAIPGYYVKSARLSHASADSMVLGNDADGGTRVTLATDGSVTITRGTDVVLQIDPDGTVNLGAAAGASFVALATAVKSALDTIQSTFDGHTHTGGTIMGLTGIPSPLIGTIDSVAATKVKAT
jgi:hypothetical protein